MCGYSGSVMEKPFGRRPRFPNNDGGATVIEYGFLFGLLAVVDIAAVTTLRAKVQRWFEGVDGGPASPAGSTSGAAAAAVVFD